MNMRFIFTEIPSRNILIKHTKVMVFIGCLSPLLRLVGLGMHDALSANPVEFIERSTGYWTLFILLATLTVTPIRLLFNLSWVMQFRRMLGLWMFFYACIHLLSYVWLDYRFNWLDMAKDLVKHPYVLVGFLAFMLTIPLAVTSSNAMIKRLRQRWKKLHQLVYVIATLGVTHFLWLVKKDIREPLLFAMVLTVLLAIRLYHSKRFFLAKH